MKPNKFGIALMFLFLLFLIQTAAAENSDRLFFEKGEFGAVSCGHPMAAKAAARILKNGGNAADAAVCAAFMLGVVDFHSSGLGGDGYALIYTPSGQVHAWDASVKLPNNHSSPPGSHYLGLPTLPEMLLKLIRLYGSRTRAEIISPAIRAARNGFKIGAHLEKNIEQKLLRITNKRSIEFLAPEGYPLRAGQILKQPMLAKTLMQLARDDGKSFYRGDQAKEIVRDMNSLGSEYCLEDLSVWRSQPAKPVRRSWQNFVIYGAPPPSSSVATIRMALNLLEKNLDLFNLKPAQVLEVAKAGKNLLDLKYYGVAQSINNPENFFNMDAGSLETNPEDANSIDGTNTTHLCVWDKNGMVISMTLTLGSHFGTGDLSPGGFFYNNGLMNYSKKVSSYPENYPVGAGPVSAKSPIIVTKDNKPFLAIGGAGSNRIIFNTALALARTIREPDSFSRVLTLPRFFMDYKNRLQIEWNPDIHHTDALKKLYPDSDIRIGGDDYFGLVSAIKHDKKVFHAIGDHRRSGSAAAIKVDPDRKRHYELEMIVKARKGLESIDLATPVNDARQKTGHIAFNSDIQLLSKSADRTRFRFRNKSDSMIIKMNVEIDPSAPENKDLNQSTDQQNSIDQAVKDFAAKYGSGMSVSDYIQHLLIDIGHEIPYRKVKKRSSASDMLKRGYGDCSGKARLFNDLLRLRGINSRLVGGLIFKKGLKATTHLWLEAELEGKWQPVCPVNQYFGHVPSNWIVFRHNEERMTIPNAQIIFQLKEKRPASGKRNVSR